MIRVKKIIVRNSSILLKDEKSLSEFRNSIGELLDVSPILITFTTDELDGTLNEDDSSLKILRKMKEDSEKEKTDLK